MVVLEHFGTERLDIVKKIFMDFSNFLGQNVLILSVQNVSILFANKI